jgi:acyl carrier protein
MDKEQARRALTTKVIDIIFSSVNLKHFDKHTVQEDTSLTKGGLNLDSIDILELVVSFEHHFGFKLNEAESYAKYFKTVGSIVDFIDQQTVSTIHSS